MDRTIVLLLRPETWQRNRYAFAGPVVARGGETVIDLVD